MVQADPPPEFTHRQILTILGGLLAGLALASLDQTIVATALPTIVGEMGGAENIAAVVSAYLVAETVATPIYGKLSDVYGRRALFRIAIVVFVVGSMLCGLSQELWQLIGFRAVQGIGAGGLISMAFATMGDVIPPRERGRYTGWFTSVFAVTSIVGPLLGGFLTDHVSWRWIFYVNVPVGAVALVVTSRALRGLRPHPRERLRLDVLGAVLLVGAVTTLLLALETGGTHHPWGSPLVVTLLVAAGVAIVAWVLWERRAEDPIVPLRLFKIDVVAVCGAMSFLVGVAMFGAITYLPLYLQVVKDVSASSSGLLLVPLMGGVLPAAMVTGRRITRTGRYAFTGPLGFGILSAAALGLASMGTGTPLVFTFALMVVLGVGLGILSPPLTIAVQNIVDPRDMGVATATNMFLRTLGAAVGVAVFGAVFAAGVDDTTSGLLREPASIGGLAVDVAERVREVTADALQPVFLCGAVVAAVGVVLALRLREVPLRSGRPRSSGPEAEVVEAIPT